MRWPAVEEAADQRRGPDMLSGPLGGVRVQTSERAQNRFLSDVHQGRRSMTPYTVTFRIASTNTGSPKTYFTPRCETGSSVRSYNPYVILYTVGAVGGRVARARAAADRGEVTHGERVGARTPAERGLH